MQKENQNLILTALVSFTLGLLVAFASVMIATAVVKPAHRPDRFQPRMEMRMHKHGPHDMKMDKDHHRGPDGHKSMEMAKPHGPDGHKPMGMEQGRPLGMIPPPPKAEGKVVIVDKVIKPATPKPMPKEAAKK